MARHARHRRFLARAAALVGPALLLASTARAENVNPHNDDSKYAYAENLGWINAQPQGPGAQGMQVSDLSVTGWLWSENAGWISLSCTNRGTCGTANYGVTNDLSGHLGGFGWGENVGWVNFAPGGTPVTIDRATGTLTGRAWGENVGWITFSATSPVSYRVQTAWCVPAPAVPAITTLGASRSGSSYSISWSAVGTSIYYDVVQGDMTALVSSGGNFSSSMRSCLGSHLASTSTSINEAVAIGNGHWYLVRAANCGGPASYNDPNGNQTGSRDPGIAASGHACP
jgi:hypothetical protein